MRVTTIVAGLCGWVASLMATACYAQNTRPSPAKIVGMYVHQHWPYNHPYAARTWTVEDWRGYADGLKKTGFNTVMIWPMLETMPDPLTPSDRDSLAKIRKVIDVLHKDLGMRVWIVLCPNVGVNSQEAAKASFEKRHFFYTDTRVNPADPIAVQKLIAWREKLLKPLAAVDAIAIIDSDPGGYPGSTNEEFVRLLGEHRKMLERLRPGIELIYWMHAGWEAYGRYYQTGKLVLGDDREHEDAVARLLKLNPEPWGIANGLPYAQKLGIPEKVILFNYGRIEGEPSFPMTNFGGDAALEGGRGAAPRGVMGNAQTHCVQLPNTFAFARGANGQTVTEADYVAFADDLIPGQGSVIVQAWRALAGRDVPAMRLAAGELRSIDSEPLQAGRLKGFLFGSPKRFINDLVLMLDMKATEEEFCTASESGLPVKEPLDRFIAAAETWQKQHGYQNMWWNPRLHAALAKLNSPELRAILSIRYDVTGPTNEQRSAFEQVANNLREIETYTPRLLAALKTALAKVR
jgi:hypothetical protein